MNILKTIVLSVVLLGHFYWNTQTDSSYFTTSKFTNPPPHFFTASPFHLPPDSLLTSFPADTLSCQGTVTFSIPYTDTCTTAPATLRTALDLDIQATNPELPPTLADFIADQADANAYFTPSDTGFVFQGDFPIGTHGLHIILEDACGGRVEELLIFEVVDVYISTPICEIGIRVVLEPFGSQLGDLDADGDGDYDTGAAIVYANELIAEPIYDCSGQYTLNGNGLTEISNYSINRVGEDSVSTQDSLILTPDDDETIVVEIHAWDEKGNQSFCTSHILVDLSRVHIGGRTYVAGNIETEEGKGVIAVNVKVEGSINQTVATQRYGFYRFENLPSSVQLRITASLNTSDLNGISTFDLVLIQRHILGLALLSSPYKMVAADINNDQQITTQDIIELRRMILGLAAGFINNTSWRFILKYYVFDNPSNPWGTTFPEWSEFDLVSDVLYIDFIAIKIGDLNGSAITD